MGGLGVIGAIWEAVRVKGVVGRGTYDEGHVGLGWNVSVRAFLLW
jgi:hypothetical protein